jgi:hypothetical protein
MTMNLKQILSILTATFLYVAISVGYAQVTITNSSFNTFNVTP